MTRAQLISVFGFTSDQIDHQFGGSLNRDQAMALAWRVRKWKLTGSIDFTLTYTEPPDPAKNNSGHADISCDIWLGDNAGGVTPADNEFRLVATAYDIVEQFGRKFLSNRGLFAVAGDPFVTYVVTGDDPASGSKNVNELGEVFFYTNSVIWMYDTATNLRSFPLAGPGSLFGGVVATTLGPNVTPSTVLALAGTGFLKVPITLEVKPLITPAFNFQLEFQWRQGGADPASTSSGTASGNLVLEAQPGFYWPFVNSQGNPVWNASTGAAVNPPLS